MKRRTLKHMKRAAKAKQRKENLGKLQLNRLDQRKTIQVFGKIAGIYKSKRGSEYFGWHMSTPDGLPGNPNSRVVPIHTLRINTLRHCTIWAAECAEKGELKPEELEIVLDYLFAELNKRINKEPKVKDAA